MGWNLAKRNQATFRIIVPYCESVRVKYAEVTSVALVMVKRFIGEMVKLINSIVEGKVANFFDATKLTLASIQHFSIQLV